MHGFLNVDKPAGLTSHDVVYRVRRWTRQRGVGHAGTLDPSATGVLPVALGHGTRLLEFWPGPKVYLARIAFGVETDSYDAEGAEVGRCDAEAVDQGGIAAALPAFVGEISQRPPRYSAVKYQGRRMYELARQGVVVEPEPRIISIASIDLVAWEPPVVTLRVTCGRGAYVRSLAHDLGQALGSCAHLQGLVRLQDGPFLVAAATCLDDLQVAFEQGRGADLVHPLEYAVRHWPWLRLAGDQQADVFAGRDVAVSEAAVQPGESAGPGGAGAPEGRVRAHGPDGALVALLAPGVARHHWHPFKVFPPQT